MKYNIAINGYGRIGRCVARALYESKKFSDTLNLVAINEIACADTIYHLRRFDSTHGRFPVNIERKKDGREFYYIRVGRHDGAFNVSEILSKYPVEGMEYKMWCPETSREWRKLQAELKSGGKELSKRAFTNELKIRLSKI